MKAVFTTILGLTMAAAISLRAEVREANFQGQPAFELENAQIKAVVSTVGGRVVSLSLPGSGKVMEGISLVEERAFPSAERFELGKLSFPGEIVTNTPERSVIRLRHKITREENRFAADMVIEKEYTLLARSSGLQIKLGVRNEATESRRPGLISSHKLGACRAVVYPSSTGPRTLEAGKDAGVKAFENLIAGWCGLVKDEAAEVVFIMDYGNLSRPAADVGTGLVEWQYDRTEIPPGQVWELNAYLVVNEGLESCAFAAPWLVADVQPAKEQVAVAIGGSFLPLPAGLTLEMVLQGWKSKKDLAAFTVPIEGKAAFPLKANLPLPAPAGEPYIVKCSLKSMEVVAEFEKPFSPKGGKLPGYETAPLLRNRVLLKPKGLQFSPDKRMLLVKGLNYYHYGIEEAAAKTGFTEVKGSYFNDTFYAQPPLTLSCFPDTFDEMYRYRVVVLTGVDASCLGDSGRALLKSFVQDGGGLLVLGGFYAFGAGRYQGTYLEEMLPITINGPFDLKKHAAVIRRAKDAPVWLAWKSPMAQNIWSHDVGLRANGKVWLQAGKEPFLVGSQYGEGRVVTCPGTVLGVADEGKKGFWETEDWANVLGGILKWLGKEL